MKHFTHIQQLLFLSSIGVLITFSPTTYAVSVDPGVISRQLSEESVYNQPSNPDPRAPLIIYQNNSPPQGKITIDNQQKSKKSKN